ncbi:unnamed protein product [Cochlearia groenlandica]
MIITKHNKRDLNLFVIQLGAAIAVTFAGFFFSRFKKRINKPNLPTLRPKPSGLGDAEKEETLLSFSPQRECDPEERDTFLLREFEEEVNKLDFLDYNECETPKSDAPLAFPSEEEDDHVNEINRLKNTVRALRERERSLEDKLLEYYSLKEQQKIAMELRSRLKLNQMETKVFNFKIKSLQSENEKLKSQCSEHSKAVSELSLAKSQVLVLKKKLNVNTQQHVEQILSLRERVAKLQEDEIKAVLSEQDADKMMKRLRDLEGEINELMDSNTRLHLENFELGEKLESVQIIANSKLEDTEEVERLRQDGNRLRSENEDLKKEIEQLQGDRCSDLEELVYLRWINACLRYELRTYKPPPGKTVARDLSTTLSPNSEEKAKNLILEYAHSDQEDHNNYYYDQWSSSQEETSSIITDSMFLDDSSVDTLFAEKAKKSGKKKLMHKLMKILHGKEGNKKKRGGSSEPSTSANTCVHSTPRELRPTHSMDFQMLLRGDEEAADSSSSSIYLESDSKKLDKYADALMKSRSGKKFHKKSVSFIF